MPQDRQFFGVSPRLRLVSIRQANKVEDQGVDDLER